MFVFRSLQDEKDSLSWRVSRNDSWPRSGASTRLRPENHRQNGNLYPVRQEDYLWQDRLQVQGLQVISRSHRVMVVMKTLSLNFKVTSSKKSHVQKVITDYSLVILSSLAL